MRNKSNFHPRDFYLDNRRNLRYTSRDEVVRVMNAFFKELRVQLIKGNIVELWCCGVLILQTIANKERLNFNNNVQSEQYIEYYPLEYNNHNYYKFILTPEMHNRLNKAARDNESAYYNPDRFKKTRAQLNIANYEI